MEQRRYVYVFAVIAGVFFIAPSAGAQDVFGDGQNVFVDDGGSPFSVAFGHLDTDAFVDMVVGTNFEGVKIRFGDGLGSFENTGPTVATGGDPYFVALGDLDGDDDLDIVASIAGGTVCSIALNDGDGGFLDISNLTVGEDPWALALDRLNDDEHLDLAVATAGTVQIHFGNGDGTFETTAQTIPAGTGEGDVRAVALGDLDCDGDIDLVAAQNFFNNPGTCSVRLNDGTGVFDTTGQEVPVGADLSWLQLGDVDLDGDLDIVTANSNDNSSSVRLNDGDGVFETTGQEVAAGGIPYVVALGDVNGDEYPDIVTCNVFADPGECHVRLNQGDGSFADTGELVVIDFDRGGLVVSIDFLTYVTLFDVDLDGDLDLAATYSHGFQNHFTGIRLNESVTFRRGDTTGDGDIGLEDTLVVVDYVLFDGAEPACLDAGDFNDDGGVDLADFIYGLSFLFRDGPEPPAPTDTCGGDLTADDLGCADPGDCS